MLDKPSLRARHPFFLLLVIWAFYETLRQFPAVKLPWTEIEQQHKFGRQSGCPPAMDNNQIITEARARIIWGESSSSVRSYLTANGISAVEADAKIKGFNAERNAEIRKMGFRRVLVGAGLLIVAAIVLYMTAISYDKQSDTSYHSSRGRAGAFGMGLLAAFYGLWKLVNGICDLVRPQSEDGSIPDMDE